MEYGVRIRCGWISNESIIGRFHWPLSLRHRSAAAHLLRSWVHIPPGAWMFVCCDCCVLSGRGLCDELITRPEESYRLWCVVVCDLKTSRMRRPWPALGRSATEKNIHIKKKNCSIISSIVLTNTDQFPIGPLQPSATEQLSLCNVGCWAANLPLSVPCNVFLFPQTQPTASRKWRFRNSGRKGEQCTK
jgi:hypothetical protein